MSHIDVSSTIRRDIILDEIGRYVRRQDSRALISVNAGVRHMRERGPFVELPDRGLGEIIAAVAIRNRRNVSFDLGCLPVAPSFLN